MNKIEKKISFISSLMEIISINKLSSYNIFSQNEKSKIHNLYKLIFEHKDLDFIIKSLGYEGPDDLAFQKLCNRLIKKMEHSLFFLDTSNVAFSMVGEVYYKLLKKTLKHNILVLLRKRGLSLESIHQDLRRTMKYGFPELSLLLAEPLRDYYGYIKPNNSKYLKVCNIIKEQLNNYNANLCVSDYYVKISYAHLYKKEDIRHTLTLIDQYKIDLKQYGTFRFSLKSKLKDFEIETLYLQIKHSYLEIIEKCNDVQRYFEILGFDSFLISFLIKQELINTYIQLKDFENALAELKKISKLYEPGHFNWFKMKNQEYYIYLLQNDLDKCYEVVYKCNKQNSIDAYSNLKETWRIKKAYFYLLIKLNYISEEYTSKYPLKDFRLNKFLNEVPVFSKEKRGLNVSILIVQMLFYIQKKNFNKYIDRLDSLKQYTYRYLKNDETFRSNCFLKMLLKIPDAQFHPVAVERHTQKLYGRLIEVKPNISDQTTNMEVIPYEKLWEITLQMLENNRN